MATIPACNRPTLYFIGVTTGRSSIMNVFPRWAEILGLDAEIRGFDVPLRAPRDEYRRIVEHIHQDPLALGALVTTHKIDLLVACRDMFDSLDPHAVVTGEVSCISKREGRLIGHAKDPISSAAAWRAFVPSGHFRLGAEVLCFGGGGSAIAISVALASFGDPGDRPGRMTIVNRSHHRVGHLKEVHAQLQTDIVFRYLVHEQPEQNDEAMGHLPLGSVVINATGMGKDIPGSPITDRGRFPQAGLAWELNYRGELDFLHQARKQAATRNLHVEDGWVYFLHGWTSVIAEVFDISIDDRTFEALDVAARDARPS